MGTRSVPFDIRPLLFRLIPTFVRLTKVTTDAIRLHGPAINPIRHGSIASCRLVRRPRACAHVPVLFRLIRLRFIADHGVNAADHVVQHLIDLVGRLNCMLVPRLRLHNGPRERPTSIHHRPKIVPNVDVLRAMRQKAQQRIQHHLPDGHTVEKGTRLHGGPGQRGQLISQAWIFLLQQKLHARVFQDHPEILYHPFSRIQGKEIG